MSEPPASVPASTAWVTAGDPARLAWRIGGVSLLERKVRELARGGATQVVVAAAPLLFERAMPVAVEFAGAMATTPAEAVVHRADVVAGVEVTDDRTRRAAEWALLRQMNKSFEGPVDALINWRMSMPITRALAQLPLTAITPNHITVVAILLGLGAAALIMASQQSWAIAIGGVMLQINSILDSCDGELARLRFQYSKLGQWLDNIADDLVDNMFVLAVGLALGPPWFWVGLAAAVGRWCVAIYTYISVYRQTGTGDVFAHRWWFEKDKQTANEVYDPRAVTTWIRSLGRRDTFVFVWMLVCVAGLPQWVVVHGGLIALIQVGTFVLHVAITTFSRPAARAH